MSYRLICFILFLFSGLVISCNSSSSVEEKKIEAIKILSTEVRYLKTRSVNLFTTFSINEPYYSNYTKFNSSYGYQIFISVDSLPDETNNIEFADATDMEGLVYYNKEKNEGIISNVIYELSPGTEYFYRIKALFKQYGDSFEKYSESKKFNTEDQLYEQGGIVFYDKGEYSDGWRYLVAAPPNWYNGEIDPKAEWGCNSVLIGTYSGENGLENTQAINNAECDDSKNGKPAYKLALELELNGFDDWYLPSIRELRKLYQFKNGGLVGGLDNETYWSSNEHAVDSLRAVIMISWGDEDTDSKTDEHRVRPIRRY
ncbi:DUF1566 domain-containing protein [Gracilimonas sediminicola]|uniref:DUF1566 domain-containing protein n=1 Tax=Gracilimonas sediminicola TaxID=2952158 RepID=A0A9X2L229_9BACT|nr:DUF1566 domain-containing protein [Gracilimonas sediminicola]MCP9290840.1 DUF1566 domain-containing protein [Gracilimonas sediminicola]